MHAAEGRVVSVAADVEPARAVIEVIAPVRCARCAAGKGCGAGLLASDDAPRRVEAVISADLELHVGDRVKLELAAQNLLRAAMLAYGLPLAGALAAASLAWSAGAGDAGAALAALTGAAVAAFTGHLLLRRKDCLQRFTPTVVGALVRAE